MTAPAIAPNLQRASDLRAVWLVSAAHFISHVYILVLPPLFPFLRAEFAVSYTELGAAIALFNILTAVLQTPAGFLVDRTSARAVLVGGLILGAGSLAAAAFMTSFYAFAAMYAVTGIANGVYHPANYALLSGCVSAPRMSQAYSVHIFAGFIGTAIAPASLLFLAAYFGWRGAFVAAALLGFAIAAAMLAFGEQLTGPARKPASEAAPARPDWHVLMSGAVFRNLVFFILLAVTGAGLQNYGIVALEALWGTPLSLATTALSVYLLMSAFAVLAGGMISARTDRHDFVAIVGLAVSALALIPIAIFDLGAAALLALMALSGFCTGVIMPSRDMLVRAVTPPGAFGKVFGFVTTGFNIGGIVAPPLFGFLMDHGSPQWVLLGSALCALASIPLVMAVARSAPFFDRKHD